MTSQQQTGSILTVHKVFIVVAGVGLLLAKIFLIGKVDLFQDEVFYWQESQRPSIAYFDLPFMTAWLIHLGTSLIGATTAGVRSAFLLLGSLIPVVMYWLAKPVVGKDNAFYAAGLCLIMPLLAFMGSIAVPDVALVVFDLLALGFFERATRTGAFRYWVLTGLCMALGFSTHYRFLPFVAAGVLYLIATENGRLCWLRPGVWVAGLIGLIGTVPLLYFSFSHDHAALSYQFLERHPWEFNTKGLWFSLEQAVLVTPLLFSFLLYVFISLIRSARQGDKHSSLFVIFASVQAGVYFLLSPFVDQYHVSFHWPLSGYLPLLVYLPSCMQDFIANAASLIRMRLRKLLVIATLTLGLVSSVVVLLAYGMQGFYQESYHKLSRGFMAANSSFAGWKEMAGQAQQLLQYQTKHPAVQSTIPAANLLVGDHYVVASQLEFYLGEHYEIYTLDDQKAGKDGRSLQIRHWDVDTRGLKKHVGENALIVLLVVERGRYSAGKHRAAIERMCSVFSQVVKLDQLSLWGGIKGFEFYSGINIRPHGGSNAACVGSNIPPLPWETLPRG